MKKPRLNGNSSALPVVESICHLAALPLSLSFFSYSLYQIALMINEDASTQGFDEQTMSTLKDAADDKTGLILFFLFIVLALARFFHAFNHRKDGKAAFVTTLFQSGMFLLCAVLPIATGFSISLLTVVAYLYAGAVSAGIIVSLVRDHRIRRVILGVLTIGLLMLCAATVTFIYIPMALWAFTSLMRYIFSRLNLKMLTQIIRKTYAAEIIFGLLLLVFSFSYLFTVFEDNLTNYWDAVWYCFAIVTTIGFGDFTAVTLIGRVLSVILGVYGIVVVALITSIIVNFYGEMKKGGNAAETEEASGSPVIEEQFAEDAPQSAEC